MTMRVAVVGAGVAGLVAAYRLADAGHRVEVFERWPGLGGQGATLDVGDGVLVERYYHHWFTSDRHMRGLYEELGMGEEIEWRPSSVATWADGRLWPFVTPRDLLTFRPLPLRSRIRMGLAVLRVRQERARRHAVRAAHRARLGRGGDGSGRRGTRSGGRSCAASSAAGPKRSRRPGCGASCRFGARSRGRSARKEMLGYPRGSFERLYTALRERIEARGGVVSIDRPVQRLARRDDGGFWVWPGAPGSFRRGLDPREFDPLASEPERFDAVVATVPNDVFEQMLDDGLRGSLAPGYTDSLGSIEYQAALCLLLEIDRQFSPYYWTNIADPEVPFIGLIEHTNFVPPELYGGRRFLYVANYLEQDDELLTLDPDALIERYEPALKRINPDFSRDWIRQRWLFREPAAQPVVTVGYHERIPPLDTGVPGLVLANTTQVYPEDRGTNYAVRLGADAAEALSAGAGRLAVAEA